MAEGEIHPIDRICTTLRSLRRYMAGCSQANDLRDVDSLLSVALSEAERLRRPPPRVN